MVFSSLAFLFIFLTVHLVAYVLVPDRLKNPVLLASSLVFYAWGGPRYLLLLMAETAVCWYCALRIEHERELTPESTWGGDQWTGSFAAVSPDPLAPERDDPADQAPPEDSYAPRPGRGWLVAACVALLGLLAFFKYTTFFAAYLQLLTGFPQELPHVVLPIGISFYTFQLISYVADVYRAEVPAQQAYWKLLLYSSLFHQCIAGPIVRYATVEADIESRRVRPVDVTEGTRCWPTAVPRRPTRCSPRAPTRSARRLWRATGSACCSTPCNCTWTSRPIPTWPSGWGA